MASVVFDTVVFVRALINPHSICGDLVFHHSEAYQLFVSPEIVTEIIEVLHRPELISKFRSLSGLDLTRVLDILSRADLVEPAELAHVSRDPNDDKFLAAARACEAAYLVSEDSDLLVLGEYAGTRIVRCAEFLDVIRDT